MSERRRKFIIWTSVPLLVAVVLGTGLGPMSTPLLGNVFAHAPSADDYKFRETQSDKKTPVTYDPCMPIHVVVNDRTAVKGADRLVAEAISEVEKASGLSFVIDGPTAERPPSGKWFAYTDGYNVLNSPVLLAWSDPKESPNLAGSILGRGGSASVTRTQRGTKIYTTGIVTLDGPQMKELLGRRDGWAMARTVVMHELGHLVGLGHVKADGEVMKPGIEVTSWGPGDLAGLRLLGSGPCVG